MMTGTMEIYQINNKRYVSPRAAARYLDIAEDQLQEDIYTGKLKAEFIASRQFIELEALHVYAENTRRNSKGWHRVNEFLGQTKITS